MSIVEKLLNIGAMVAEKTGGSGKGKAVGKVGEKSVLFGSTLAKLGKDVSTESAPAKANDNVSVKRVKLSRGGLEVEISYPKSLLESKGTPYVGKESKDPAILHELSDKKVLVKGQSEKPNGAMPDENLEQNVLESLKAGANKKVLNIDEANVKKSLETVASVGSSNEVLADKKLEISGSTLSDKSVLKKVKSEEFKGSSIAEHIGKTHTEKKNQTEDAKDTPVSASMLHLVASNGETNPAGKLPSKDNPDIPKSPVPPKSKKNGPESSSQVTKQAMNSKGTEPTVGKSDKSAVSHDILHDPAGKLPSKDNPDIPKSQVSLKSNKSESESLTHQVTRQAMNFKGTEPAIGENGKSAVSHDMLLDPAGKTIKDMTTESTNVLKSEKTNPSKGTSGAPISGKLKTVETSQGAPNVVRDRYYGQRIVENNPQVNDVPKDKVEIKGSVKAGSRSSHVSGNDGLTGTVDSKSVNSQLSMGGHKQHTGTNSNGQEQTRQIPDNKIQSDKTPPKIDPTSDTVSHARSAQTGNSAPSVATPAQVNVPRVVAERLVSLVQKSSQPAQQQTWQKHRLVMDNGQTLNVSARSSNGVLHLQLSGGNQDLNTLLQQHIQEIQNHLQEKMQVQVDLHFQNQSNGQPAQQFQQQSGNRGTYHRPANIISNDFDERTAEPNGRPLSNRRLGYNNTEWTA